MGEYPERKQRIPAHIQIRINNAYLAEALNVSEKGMYIFSPHTFLKDSLVEIAINISGDTTELTGQIIHVHPGVGFGVSFPDLPDDVATLIRQVLEGALDEEFD